MNGSRCVSAHNLPIPCYMSDATGYSLLKKSGLLVFSYRFILWITSFEVLGNISQKFDYNDFYEIDRSERPLRSGRHDSMGVTRKTGC